MSITSHMVQAVARERVADLQAEAAAYRAAAESAQRSAVDLPVTRPQPIQHARPDLIPDAHQQ